MSPLVAPGRCRYTGEGVSRDRFASRREDRFAAPAFSLAGAARSQARRSPCC
jgi:hypothetical protein